MFFNSVSFYIFFPIVTLGYFLLPQRWRWMWLLAASAYFYMSFIPLYIFLIGGTISVNYFTAIAMENSEGKRRKTYLLLGLVIIVGMLAVFKYFNFFNANMDALANWLGWNYPIPMLKLALPVGLSFYTLQSMAYLIEVERGGQKAEKHFGVLALYVMFYPQLLAGPIGRPQKLLPQFHEEQRLDYNNAADGLRLMAWGFFKKLVIADRLALLVNPVYTDPGNYPGPLLALAVVAFAYQIYCDFSGYSDIAIGAARVMGFRLMNNFDRPYAARSITEFWQRWHISLSSWLRDYIFFPLRRSLLRRKRRLPDWLNQAIPTLTTMLISGLWHGANWTFVLWGALHGIYLTLELWTANLRERVAHSLRLDRLPALRHGLQTAFVFCLVSFTLIFFRAGSLAEALYFIRRLFEGYDLSQIPLWVEQVRVTLGQNYPLVTLIPALTGWQVLGVMALQIVFLETVQFLQKDQPLEHILAGQHALVRWGIYYSLIANIILFGAYLPSRFIYFQF
jgi:alginate O-acetyltransferase complex protein AlgI